MKDKFINALQSGELVEWVRALGYQEIEEATELLVQEHNAGSIDLIVHFKSLDTSEFTSRDLMNWARVFQDAIPQIECETDEIFTLTTNLIEASKSSSDHYLYTGFGNWLEQDDERASDIFKLIVEKNGDSELTYTCLMVWCQHDQDSALDGLLSTIDSGHTVNRSAAIRALKHFDIDTCDRGGEAIVALQKVTKDGSPADISNAVFTATCLLEKSSVPIPLLVDTLESACNEPEPEVRRELIGSWTLRPSAFPDHLRDEVFKLISTVPGQDLATMQYVDTALRKLDIDSDRDVVLSILNSLLTLENGAHKLKQLDSTSYALLKVPNALTGWYVVNWLLSGNPFLCRAVFDLFPPLNRSVINFSLDEFELTDDEVFYLARKVFAYLLLANEVAVSLLAACLLKLSGDSQSHLAEAIADFWLRNYPQDIELFDALLKQDKGLTKPVKIIKRLRKEYLDGLEAGGENSALAPSSNERRIQFEIESQRHKKMYKDAEKNSVLLSIMPVQPVLYGNTVISYMHKGSGEPPVRQEIAMQSHSMSTAIPRMDILCPGWLNYLRFTYRMEERPE